MQVKGNIDFLVRAMEIILSSGKKVKIYRRGLGYFYQFRAAILKLYIDPRFLQEVIHYAGVFIEDGFDIQKLSDEDTNELFGKIIDFNTRHKQTLEEVLGEDKPKEPKEMLSEEEANSRIEQLEENYIALVDVLAGAYGWTIEHISENISEAQALSLLYYINQRRAAHFCDNRAAAQAVDASEHLDAILGRERLMIQ